MNDMNMPIPTDDAALLEYRQQAKILGLRYRKRHRLLLSIYLSVLFASTIAVCVLASSYVRQLNNAEIKEKIANVVLFFALIFVVWTIVSADWTVHAFSSKLRLYKKQYEHMNCKAYPEVYAFRDNRELLMEEVLSPLKNRVITLVAIWIIAFGLLTAIFALVFRCVIPQQLFFVLLAGGIFVFLYGCFLGANNHIFGDMLYPFMFTLLCVIPPMLVFRFGDMAQWLRIVVACLAGVAGLTVFILFIRAVYYKSYKTMMQYLEENRQLYETIESTYPSSDETDDSSAVLYEICNKKGDRASVVLSGIDYFVVIERKTDDDENAYVFVKKSHFARETNARFFAVHELLALYTLDDGRPEHEFAPIVVDERIRKDYRAFDIKIVYDKLLEYDLLKGKMRLEKDMIYIDFHKYLHVQLADDYCEYFNTHWHPSTVEEAVEFVVSLLNEQDVFVTNRFILLHEIYPGYCLEGLIRKKNKRGYRVFSAIKIYVDK
jgi:hypothetical protein